jgi:hypothetical protein
MEAHPTILITDNGHDQIHGSLRWEWPRIKTGRIVGSLAVPVYPYCPAVHLFAFVAITCERKQDGKLNRLCLIYGVKAGSGNFATRVITAEFV